MRSNYIIKGCFALFVLMLIVICSEASYDTMSDASKDTKKLNYMNYLEPTQTYSLQPADTLDVTVVTSRFEKSNVFSPDENITVFVNIKKDELPINSSSITVSLLNSTGSIISTYNGISDSYGNLLYSFEKQNSGGYNISVSAQKDNLAGNNSVEFEVTPLTIYIRTSSIAANNTPVPIVFFVANTSDFTPAHNVTFNYSITFPNGSLFQSGVLTAENGVANITIIPTVFGNYEIKTSLDTGNGFNDEELGYFGISDVVIIAPGGFVLVGYYPGDEVTVSAWIVDSNGEAIEGKAANMTLYIDGNNIETKIETKTAISDEFGIITNAFSIPISASYGLGRVWIETTASDGSIVNGWILFDIIEQRSNLFNIDFNYGWNQYPNSNVTTKVTVTNSLGNAMPDAPVRFISYAGYQEYVFYDNENTTDENGSVSFTYTDPDIIPEGCYAQVAFVTAYGITSKDYAGAGCYILKDIYDNSELNESTMVADMTFTAKYANETNIVNYSSFYSIFSDWPINTLSIWGNITTDENGSANVLQQLPLDSSEGEYWTNYPFETPSWYSGGFSYSTLEVNVSVSNNPVNANNWINVTITTKKNGTYKPDVKYLLRRLG